MNAPFLKLSCDAFGVKADRLLLPIDLAKCPPEIFPLANGFVRQFGGEIVLLHVLESRMNTAQVGGSDIDARRAKRHLERLGRDYLRPTLNADFRVRIGIPHETILAEAAATNADLILLSVFAPPIWRRWVGFSHGETARNLVAGAPCRVFAVNVRTHFNCFRRWTRKEFYRQCAA